MEKQYHIEFPQLMKGKKVMYVHGFASSAQSGTVALLRQLMPAAEIVADDIPLVPQDAINFLRSRCEEEKPDLIIGSSAGGMMTEQLYGYDRILVNPAFQMGDTMGKHGMIGKQTYQNPRRDGVQEFIVTKALVKQFADLTEQCFDEGKLTEALAIQKRILPFEKALFMDVNPIPVKEALNIMGFKAGECRLPLCSMTEEQIAKLKATMEPLGLVGKIK